MKTLLTCLIAAASLYSVSAAVAAPLDGLQSKKRPLLLFSKSRSDASMDKQVDLLRNFRPELSDRDMIVLRTSGSEETRSVIGYTSLNRGAARELRQQFEPYPLGLTVVLVGKDGTEKKRWNRVAQPQEIFELIDTMPMRQDELNNPVTN